MTGFMADFDADLARPYGFAPSGGSATITGFANGIVSGVAPPLSVVVVTANGVYAGNTTANATGQWSLGVSGIGLTGLGAAAVTGSTLQAFLYSAYNAAIALAGQAFTNGNNTVSDGSTSGTYKTVLGTLSRSTGKFYFETRCNGVASSNVIAIGIAPPGAAQNVQLGQQGTSDSFRPDGYHYSNNGYGGTSFTYAAGDTIGIAVDIDGHTIYYGKNGTWYNSANPSAGTGGINLSPSSWAPACSTYGAGDSFTLNTGGSPFKTTPPSGFLPWG